MYFKYPLPLKTIHLTPQRIVITGGPSTGKTALINYLQKQGHTSMAEISREVIQQAQLEGIEQLFLTDPVLFSQKLVEGRLVQFKKAVKHTKTSHLFYDRGLPDVMAYLNYINTPYPKHFEEVCKQYRYDVVFLLPPWEEIYKQDKERYETFEQATKIYQYLQEAYRYYSYTVIEVPVGSLKERMHYIVNQHLS